MKSRMGRITLRITGITLLLLFGLTLAAPRVYATDLPSSTPTVEEFNVYRDVLEDDDFLLIVYENTPYSGTPDRNYSESFIWRLKSTDGLTEYAQAVGYNYNNDGWGYNVVSFYLDSGNVTALMGAGYWEKAYKITLTGTPAAYASPPTYTFTLSPSDYSSLTDTAEVKTATADRLIVIAADLDNKWGLSVTYSLIDSSEVGNVLSIYGESFFRGAIYGVQAMAPSIFSLSISNINIAERTFTPVYITELGSQYTGTYLEPAMLAGEGFFAVSYNLFGILLILLVCAFIVGGNWLLSGGNLWKGGVESAGPLIIGARLAMIPMGEFGLIVALCWFYVSAKVWKLI